jgi:hypothetical protein
VIENFEIITTDDKAKRDDIYRQLRESTDPFERQAVKFSSARQILDQEGAPLFDSIRYVGTGKGGKITLGRSQSRPVCISTWSVGYPRT